MVAAGMVMFSTAGFMLTPDSPLLLFVTLFFYAYQQYLKTDNKWTWALILGVTIAGMLYSKYMGVLVVAFTVVSNWRLMKDGRLWCALGLAVALLLPHFWWQYSHNFPSLQYHLVARNDGFDIDYILEYWPNQLVVFNPLSLVVMLCAGAVAFRHRRDNRFEGALATTIWGFLIFFWVMTLKGHAEPHWTMAASVPAIILLTRYIEDGPVLWLQRKWVGVTLWVMVGLCLIARVVLWTNLLGIGTGLGSKRARYDSIKELCGDRVMVVIGSFQWPSMYRFWEGESVLIHDINERHTHYELIDLDYRYQGVEASIMEVCPGSIDTIIRNQTFHWKLVDHLQMTDRVQLNQRSIRVEGDSLYGEISAYNAYPIAFDWQHEEMPAKMQLVSLQEGTFLYTPCVVEGPQTIAARDSAAYIFRCSWRDLTTKDSDTDIRYIYTLNNGVGTTQNSPVLQLLK